VSAPPDLVTLSHAEKDALILALFAQLASARERIAAQDARIAALEARLDELTRPPKTPDNSSKPPSQGWNRIGWPPAPTVLRAGAAPARAACCTRTPTA